MNGEEETIKIDAGELTKGELNLKKKLTKLIEIQRPIEEKYYKLNIEINGIEDKLRKDNIVETTRKAMMSEIDGLVDNIIEHYSYYHNQALLIACAKIIQIIECESFERDDLTFDGS